MQLRLASLPSSCLSWKYGSPPLPRRVLETDAADTYFVLSRRRGITSWQKCVDGRGRRAQHAPEQTLARSSRLDEPRPPRLAPKPPERQDRHHAEKGASWRGARCTSQHNVRRRKRDTSRLGYHVSHLGQWRPLPASHRADMIWARMNRPEQHDSLMLAGSGNTAARALPWSDAVRRRRRRRRRRLSPDNRATQYSSVPTRPFFGFVRVR